MVDTEKRAEAAKLIDEFFAGAITNLQFEDRYPLSKDDPALNVIHSMLWFNYSDINERRFDPKEMTDDGRRLLEHARLFLRSGHEYTGEKKFLDLVAIPRRLWSWITLRRQAALPQYWPFESEAQLEETRAKCVHQ